MEGSSVSLAPTSRLKKYSRKSERVIMRVAATTLATVTRNSLYSRKLSKYVQKLEILLSGIPEQFIATLPPLPRTPECVFMFAKFHRITLIPMPEKLGTWLGKPKDAPHIIQERL